MGTSREMLQTISVISLPGKKLRTRNLVHKAVQPQCEHEPAAPTIVMHDTSLERQLDSIVNELTEQAPPTLVDHIWTRENGREFPDNLNWRSLKGKEVSVPSPFKVDMDLECGKECLEHDPHGKLPVCTASLPDWCAANRLSNNVCSALMEEGADSFDDMFYFSEAERVKIVDFIGGLKLIEKMKRSSALASSFIDLYSVCTNESKTFAEYQELRKSVRQHGHVNATDTGSHSQKMECPNPADDTKPAETSVKRPSFPPGIHMVPHKVITLDREKAMRDNHLLKDGDFISLAKDVIFIRDGGDLKVVLFVGSTGSGKSTTINSYVNYLFGVKFDDTYRLKLVNEPPTSDRASLSSSQTHQVLGYLLEAPPAFGGGKDWLLIIDTPGFGDTRGLQYDMNTVDEIRSFFDTQINYLHAVCFVVKGTETKLGNRNRWIFDQVLGLFGKDISEIITLLMTFSDAAEPLAMTVINDADVEYEDRFKLNNSAFFLADNGKRDGGSDYDINEMFWRAGNRAFEAFSKVILTRREKGLDETRIIWKRRERLKVGIGAVRLNIDLGKAKLEKLNTTISEITRAQTLIDTNKDFEFEELEMEIRRVPKIAKYNTVCSVCSWTCHGDCNLNDACKMKCTTMDKDSGLCTVCPNKCHWSMHKNLDYYYERVPVKKKKTNQELYARYVNASSDKSNFEQIMEGLKKEYKNTQIAVYNSLREIQRLISELQHIALRPSLHHDDEYFDIMVEIDRKEKRTGWQRRIKI